MLHAYDLRKGGIAIPIWLRSGSKLVNLEAKLDTGATYCMLYISHYDDAF